MSSDPLVSICIPTYNNAAMLREAIASALAQTYRSIEVIVSDNASTDDTASVVATIRDSRLRCSRNTTNLGMVANFRCALAESRGRYVCLLSSDDLMDPGFVEWAVDALEGDPEAMFAFAGIRFVGARQGEVVWPFPSCMAGREFILRSLRRAQNLVHMCGAMARRDWVERMGLEDLTFFDWTLWLRLASHGNVRYTPQVLASYRVHAANETMLTMQRYSLHLLALSRTVSAYADREQPEDELRCAVSHCFDLLFARYAGQLGRASQLSWPAFVTDLLACWRAPVSLPVRLRETGRSVLIRLRDRWRSSVRLPDTSSDLGAQGRVG